MFVSGGVNFRYSLSQSKQTHTSKELRGRDKKEQVRKNRKGEGTTLQDHMYN